MKEESTRVIRIPSVLAIAATLGLAAGCGGDDDDEETAATEATTTEAESVGMTEYRFDPARRRLAGGHDHRSERW